MLAMTIPCTRLLGCYLTVKRPSDTVPTNLRTATPRNDMLGSCAWVGAAGAERLYLDLCIWIFVSSFSFFLIGLRCGKAPCLLSNPFGRIDKQRRVDKEVGKQGRGRTERSTKEILGWKRIQRFDRKEGEEVRVRRARCQGERKCSKEEQWSRQETGKSWASVRPEAGDHTSLK